MSLRREFALLASQPDANHAQLCQRFGISRTTGYKWTARYRDGGDEALGDRSRRPARSPTRTPPHVEADVLALRDAHTAWGARKIHTVLARTLGSESPAPSTITAILRRHSRLAAEPPTRDHVRFEAEAPNDLWQMDFKGDFLLGDGARCYPLTLTDDHSRFALCIEACADQRRATVAAHLSRVFARYGLPRRLLCDNGPPWGTTWGTDGAGRRRPHWTRLGAWLVRRGVTLVHGRPYHPQTQGKQERFHRSLDEEVIAPLGGGLGLSDMAACQARFAAWRSLYNEERPHEGIAMAVPSCRYRVSARAAPTVEPVVAYDVGTEVRRVSGTGEISFRGEMHHVGKGFAGERVGLRASEVEGVWSVWYAHQEVWAVRVGAP